MNASTSLIRPVRATLARVRLPLTFAHQPIHRTASSAPTPDTSAAPLSAPGPSTPPKSRGPKRPVSSCPAGTVMTGLAVLKDQSDPVALPDDQYPDWLWTIIPDTTKSAAAKEKDSGETTTAGELKTSADFRQEKKRLRSANRADIKGANYLKTT